MTQEERQKLIANHELEMMRLEHRFEQELKQRERQHELDMLKLRGGWLGKLFGCN